MRQLTVTGSFLQLSSMWGGVCAGTYIRSIYIGWARKKEVGVRCDVCSRFARETATDLVSEKITDGVLPPYFLCLPEMFGHSLCSGNSCTTSVIRTFNGYCRTTREPTLLNVYELTSIGRRTVGKPVMALLISTSVVRRFNRARQSRTS